MKKALIALSVILVVIIAIGWIFTYSRETFLQFLGDPQNSKPNTNTEIDPLEDPQIELEVVLENLTNPWDIDFIDENQIIYTQRPGLLSIFDRKSGESRLIEDIEDVFVLSEGGLLGLTLDREFDENFYVYLCMATGNVLNPSVKVSRFTLNDDLTQVTQRKDIITGMPAIQVGRHFGCRLEMSNDNVLWVSTGDAATGTNPQDPKNLGGKILRVDREGNGVSGNLGGEFDPRIFSFGHRNSQGLALFDEPVDGSWGYSSEHGSNRDDEINSLVPGNFGWDPIPGYNENVEMTDLDKYPDAIPALWNSGNPTIAISGMTIVRGKQWGAWENALLVAVQKDQYIRLVKFDNEDELVRDELVIDSYGRIRTVQQSPDGSLYFTTDNGRDKDQIVRITVKK